MEHDPSKPHKGGRKRKLNEDGSEPPPKMHSRGFAFVTFLCENDAANAVTKSSGLRVCNRDVAIDYCMGKGVYERTNAEGDMRLENDEGEEDEEEGEEEDGEKDEEEGADEDDDDDNDNDEEEEEEEEEEKGAKKKEENDLDDVVEGCTVFLRDLPYDADHRDLRKALGTFGCII